MGDIKLCPTCGDRMNTKEEILLGECYRCLKLHSEKFHKKFDINKEKGKEGR